MVNIIVAAFNTVPAFPLAGGRRLRAALRYQKGGLRGATCITSHIGAGLIVPGALAWNRGIYIGAVQKDQS